LAQNAAVIGEHTQLQCSQNIAQMLILPHGTFALKKTGLDFELRAGAWVVFDFAQAGGSPGATQTTA